MSEFGRWSLGIGIVLVVIAIGFSAADIIAPSAIVGIAGLSGIGMAGYDVLCEATARWAQRRNAKKARRTAQNY